MAKQENLLQLIENNQTVIKQIGSDLTNIEKCIKGIYLWINKLNQHQSELEIKLHTLNLAIAEKETGMKIEDITIPKETG